MPTLLQFNTVANVASTGRLAEDLGEVVIQHGWDSYIAYGREGRQSSSNLVKIGTKKDVYLHLLKARLFDRQGFGSAGATKKLLKQIDEIRPDVIQFHNLHGYYLNLPILFNYIADKNIPVVWSLHDCWSMTGHCGHFALVGCDKWKTQCYNCPIIHSYPESWFVDNSRRNYTEKKRLENAIPRMSIVSGSQWLADIAKQSFNKNRDVHVIPDGINTDIFTPKEDGGELRRKYGLEGKFVIMASGTSWSSFKGLEDFKKLRKVLPEDFAMIFVGMSDSDRENLLPGMIGIPRTKTPNELASFYSMADCIMSLSKLESFGLTPVEGFACGTPAIVNDCTALPELITPETGFVVRASDICDIKDKVIELKKRGKASYTNDCRRIALEKYDRKVCYKKYLDIYESMIK